MIDLKKLNPDQQKAVEFTGPAQMIVAGAGSGKTKVLTYKVAYLLKHGYSPESILALTFTNKSANEMKSRIVELVGKKAESIWMGTFHSIFARILRVEAKYIDYKPNFSIYDTEDSYSLVSNIMTNFNIEIEGLTVNSVRHRISFLKNHMIMPSEYRKKFVKTFRDEKIAEIYEEYQLRLVANNAMDFEDLLLKPIQLFNSNEKILHKYKSRFNYILVDEFQDTNKSQYELLKLLVSRSCKIAVVGDDAQSIYSWRGANLGNMQDFRKDFKNHKLFKLEQNYRSTKTILTAADSVIKYNKNQVSKTLWTENSDGEPLTLIRCADEKDEAFQLAKAIKKEISKKKLSYKDFAILYRTNAQSRVLEDIFYKEKIPYIIIGGVEFYRRKEVKDVIAYLHVIANTNDEESILRIMNFPQRGIGNTTVTRMIAFARKHDLTLFQTMNRVFEVIDIKERIQKNVKGFRVLLEKYIKLKDTLSVGELSLALIDELGLVKMFKSENTPESQSRLENINQLMAAISEYSKEHKDAKLDQFLEDVSLISDIDMKDDKKNAVTLLTVHSAKGLEFPTVFISGLEEEIFPLANRFSEDASVEEERRLFYVAVTRAQKKVYLSHARSRYRFGEVAYQSRSRFIDEIEPSTVQEINGGIGRKANRKTKKELFYEYFNSVDYDDFDQENKVVRVGSRVMHEKFGLGKVIDVTGAGDMVKATVTFEGNNVRQLMLKFARLKILH
ncbi:MAG: UvrD-helicase domain-containing protein [Ignavibacteriota bacterium]|jgi:DNA helicase-2/ATP-dependent DNA helicase PcrA|nr:MAG: DNA helicase [Chlorobiota bacterium]MBE7477133.1 UvrD-helicase domain-containing protein [Ignavibacteriales bacterium]MBL1121335.1 DNA helicase [Ignavibacteriota bacterium]MCC7094826.1 UvrD-helicase domain-containing protein [Ignavibacteriaceae bacterium]MCE7855169.1 DNA helicase [Ignavibacteria bacterium CHB3]MEB2295949.1 UvrD-helicase domain-containing protein [Ignavibacteria bacterium]